MRKTTQPEDRAESRLVDTVAEIIGGLSALGLAGMLLLAIVQAIATVVGAGPEVLLGHWALAAAFLGLLLWLAHGLRGRRRWARLGVIIYCVVVAVVHIVRSPWGVLSFIVAGVAAVVAVLLAGPTVGREFGRRDV